MVKIAFIGAGSHTFTQTLVRGVLSFPALQDSTLSLMDIDAGRLERIEAARTYSLTNTTSLRRSNRRLIGEKHSRMRTTLSR